MKNKIVIIILLFVLFFTLTSCNADKVNSNIYYSTQFIDKFELEEVKENDYDKIPLKNDLYYKINSERNEVTFYENNSMSSKKIEGTILNNQIILFNDSKLCIVYDDKYKIYDFDKEIYFELNYNLEKYDNLSFYAIDYLYLIGSKENKTNILKLDDNYRIINTINVPLNTLDGIVFLHFWDEYYIIQNNKYEYYTNCDRNLTKLNIENQLVAIDDEIYTLMHFYHTATYDAYDSFFKHNLFYEDDSYEKEYYDGEALHVDYDIQRAYKLHFYDKNIFLSYKTDQAKYCFQAYYNHTYYFILGDCFYEKETNISKGYYLIRYDVINSKFEISELNMQDRIEEFKQIGNQIQLKINRNNENVRLCYYIK